MGKQSPAFAAVARTATIVTALTGVLPGETAAQTPSSSAAGEWMCACPGRPKPRGNAPSCEVACFGSGSSVTGAMSYQQRQDQINAQFVGAFTQALIQSYAANPQRDAEERARQEAWRKQLERMRAEEARRMEETKARLLAMMKGIGPAPDLKFKLDSPSPAPGTSGNVGALSFRFGDASPGRTLADLPATSPMAQLTRAAFFSEQAVAATTPEDAWAFADAAFNATIGVQVDLDVPTSVQALGIRDADMPAVQSARNGYVAASERLHNTATQLAELEQQRELAERVQAEARARLAEAQRSGDVQQVAQAQRIASEAEALMSRLREQKAALDAEARANAKAVDDAAIAARDLLERLRQRERLQRASENHASAPPPPPRNKPVPDRHRPPDGPALDAYLRGLEDAMACSSQRGSLVCRDAGASCMEHYVNGYRFGEIGKESRLRQAYSLGQQARANNNHLVPLNHPQAGGPCFYYWRQAFFSGLGDKPFTMIGR